MENKNETSDYDPNDSVYCHYKNKVDFFGSTSTAIFGSWLSLTIAAATLGNLMVIIVILTNRSMRDLSRGTNMFLLSLSVADLLVGMLMSPIALYTTIRECWNLGDLMCSINSFLNTLLLSTSVHTLMYISIFKCICIHRVANNNFVPPQRWVWNSMIVCAWIWGFLFAFLTTSVLGESRYKPKTMQCGPMYPTRQTTKMYVLHATNQFMSLMLPFGIMIFCYAKIYRDIKKSGEFRRQQNVEDSGVIKTFLVVLVCFLLCWMPYCFYTNYATLLHDKREIPFFLNPVAYCCGYMNSACNPIIYAWRFPEFRNGYKDILCKKPSYIVSIGPGGRRRIQTHRRSSALSNSSNASAVPRKAQGAAIGSVTSDKSANGRNGERASLHGGDRDSVFVHEHELTLIPSAGPEVNKSTKCR